MKVKITFEIDAVDRRDADELKRWATSVVAESVAAGKPATVKTEMSTFRGCGGTPIYVAF